MTYIPAPPDTVFWSDDIVEIYKDEFGVYQMNKKKKEIWFVYNTDALYSGMGSATREAIFETYGAAASYAESKPDATKLEKQQYSEKSNIFYENNHYRVDSAQIFTHPEDAILERDKSIKDKALAKLTKEERTLLGFDA